MEILKTAAGVLARLARKIRRMTVVTVLAPVAWAGGVLWSLVSRQVVVEDEEVQEAPEGSVIAAASAVDVVEPVRREPPKASLAALIKWACSLREVGDARWEDVFHWDDRQHDKARLWVDSLSELQLMSVRHMPTRRLEEHLANDCSVGLSLPTWRRFDIEKYVARKIEEQAAAARRREMKARTQARRLPGLELFDRDHEDRG